MLPWRFRKNHCDAAENCFLILHRWYILLQWVLYASCAARWFHLPFEIWTCSFTELQCVALQQSGIWLSSRCDSLGMIYLLLTVSSVQLAILIFPYWNMCVCTQIERRNWSGSLRKVPVYTKCDTKHVFPSAQSMFISTFINGFDHVCTFGGACIANQNICWISARGPLNYKYSVIFFFSLRRQRLAELSPRKEGKKHG